MNVYIETKQVRKAYTILAVYVVAIVGTNFSEIVFSIPGVRVLKSYSPIKQAFYDYKVNVKVPSLESRFKEYVSLKEKDWSVDLEAYILSKLKSRKDALIWLSNNLSTHRPLREPQLFILGKPKSGKSTFLQSLNIFLLVYDLPSRRDDF